jgi:hypothetical protein
MAHLTYARLDDTLHENPDASHTIYTPALLYTVTYH